MGRKQKHPEHAAESQRLMNSLLDEVVALWESEKEPELKAMTEERTGCRRKSRGSITT